MSYEMDYQDYQRALQFDQRASGVVILRSLNQVLIDHLDPKETDKVIDVGTGTGRLGTVICQMVPKGAVIGIDSGSGMLRVAQEKITKNQINNYHIVRGKAEVLPFPPQVFDSAYLMLSFHHFTEPEKAAAEVYRILRPNGFLISVDPVLKEAADDADKKLNAVIEEAFQLAHGPEFRFLTTTDLRRLYERVGFSVQDIEAYNFPFHQNRLEEIPMGAHWLQAYELLQSRQEASLINKFEQNYLTFQQRNRRILAGGKISWVAIKAVRN